MGVDGHGSRVMASQPSASRCVSSAEGHRAASKKRRPKAIGRDAEGRVLWAALRDHQNRIRIIGAVE